VFARSSGPRDGLRSMFPARELSEPLTLGPLAMAAGDCARAGLLRLLLLPLLPLALCWLATPFRVGIWEPGGGPSLLLMSRVAGGKAFTCFGGSFFPLPNKKLIVPVV